MKPSETKQLRTVVLALIVILVPYYTVSYLARDTVEYADRDTAVLYAFANTDPEYLNNFNFFIKEAMEKDDRSYYMIIVQGDGTKPKNYKLPKLPPHAKYYYHKNECYDWGSLGWLLDRIKKRYKYYIFVNCSVRGPYLPPYAKGKIHWTEPFLSKLNNEVKLVGPTISCEASSLLRDSSSPWRHNPHVQSYALAMEEEGLEILKATNEVFICHLTRLGTIFYSELGASLAILNAGHNIASFMTKYAGIDWRDRNTWGCNAGISPTAGRPQYDNILLDAYEAMFIKYKSILQGNPVMGKAIKYDQWSDDTQHTNLARLHENSYFEHEPAHRVKKVALYGAYGRRCFDDEFYASSNPDLAPLDRALLWRHFLYFGQFDRSRPFRMNCTIADAERNLGS